MWKICPEFKKYNPRILYIPNIEIIRIVLKIQTNTLRSSFETHEPQYLSNIYMIIKHNSIILSLNTKFAFNRFFGKYFVYLEKNNKKNWVNRKNLICWLAFGKLDVTSRIEYWWCNNLCPLIHGVYSFEQLAIGGLIAESVVL